MPDKNLLVIEKFAGLLKETDVVYENPNTNGTYVFSGIRVIDVQGNKVEIHSNHSVIYERLGLQICAPIADMDTSGMRLADGYKLEIIPDPVVLQPVKAGYLIVTAWGDEASDEMTVNSNHN